jgi:hypothetical protein
MMSPTLELIILFLALEAALAAGPAEEVGKLLICEVSCQAHYASQQHNHGLTDLSNSKLV